MRLIWIAGCLGDVSADLSRFHGVKDASKMRSADFFAAAARLPFADGAVAMGMRREYEHGKTRGVPLTADRMRSPEFAGRPGLAPVFEIG